MEAAEEVGAEAGAPGQVEQEVAAAAAGEEGAAVEEVVAAPRAGPPPRPGTPAGRPG